MKPSHHTSSAYFSAETCSLESFKATLSRTLSSTEAPYAARIERNIPLYDMAALRALLSDAEQRQSLMAEWAAVLRDLSGVVILKNAYEDRSSIDAATEVFNEIIAAEKAEKGGGADHFAAAGNNDRIWNALQKLCERAPEVFAAYFSNPAIDTVCEAWLGPNYQMTAQVNLVRPGAAAQESHRDYHLGFQTEAVAASYPAHVHSLSPFLTLQGGIAHIDMPVESGPTKFLPFSQLYRPGYMAWRRPDFRAFFEENYVQLPLAKGDALFFNPAVFHAAGANSSADIERMANLLQISSAFGRAMENIDRRGICARLYPVATQMKKKGLLSGIQLSALLAASAEGYSFPTNLDRDPPDDGLAPESQQALFHRALREDWPQARFLDALAEQSARQEA